MKQEFEEFAKMKQKFEKDIKEMKQEAEVNKEAFVQVISEMQGRLDEKDQINKELNDQLSFYFLFFGKSFKIAQESYLQERFNRLSSQLLTVINNFTNDTSYFDKSDSLLNFSYEELKNEHEVVEEFINDNENNVKQESNIENFNDIFEYSDSGNDSY
ncbi:hypothetical protein C2G38_2220472 [Gigaspora rosea]|uniref:Uncharacterized protein n=1 Tax=Gigaspora rosea TaxID=44941 RepID=A0A397U645_9GLOM|nr:hypothetical protein C2G38_2220472 [Gigaspora rosea]